MKYFYPLLKSAKNFDVRLLQFALFSCQFNFFNLIPGELVAAVKTFSSGQPTAHTFTHKTA